MHVNVIGCGFVGATITGCFATHGYDVTVVDSDPDVVSAIEHGESPVAEPGLDELFHDTDITATTDYSDIPDHGMSVVCVPTPTRERGIDTSMVSTAVSKVANHVDPDGKHQILVKSTVTPPAVDSLRSLVPEYVSLAIVPEFLSEGSAISDFRSPDKLVIGAYDETSRELIHILFTPFKDYTTSIHEVSPKTASLIKYANNITLASKISLANELGNICKQFGVDSHRVMDAVTDDDRVADAHLTPGMGYGGGCLPKDLTALARSVEQHGYNPRLLTTVDRVNDTQPEQLLSLAEKHTDLSDQRVAILGLSFKPGVADVDDSQALKLIDYLRFKHTSNIHAHDPVANENMKSKRSSVTYHTDPATALDDAVAAFVMTGWDEYATLDFEFNAMDEQVVVDGTRVIDPPSHITYEGICW